MHYGNLKFKQKQREEQAEPDGTEGTSTIHTQALYTLEHLQTQAVIHGQNHWLRLRMPPDIVKVLIMQVFLELLFSVCGLGFF